MRETEYSCPKCALDLSKRNQKGRIEHLKKCKEEEQVDLVVENGNCKNQEIDLFCTEKGPKNTLLDYFVVRDKLKFLGKPVSAPQKKRSKNGMEKIDLPTTNSKFPFYKKIEGTTLVVDGFRHSAAAESTKFILSHWHSDHYGGLTNGWNYGFIYASEVTAKLLILNFPNLSSRVIPLPFFSRVRITDDKGVECYVTFMDANHCPGAAVMLFEVGQRKILHVGDMRFKKQMQTWAGWSTLPPIDLCYLDTTYCNPKHTFPAQDEMIDFASNVAVNADKNTLILVGTYYIGKEKILAKMASLCNVKIYAMPSKLKVLRLLGFGDIWTSDIHSTNIRIVSLRDISHRNLASVLKEAKSSQNYKHIIGIRPSGWSGSCNFQTSGNSTIYNIPYSEHSSYNELLDFMAYVKPKRINPTVSNSSAARVTQMKNWLGMKI